MDGKEYNEIRELLDRWYDGAATPAEESRLRELTAEAGDTLPEGLSADLRLFAGITEAASGAVPMPEELSRRVGSALDEEIARSDKGFFSRRRWRIAAVAASAACVAALFFTYTPTEESMVAGRGRLTAESHAADSVKAVIDIAVPERTGQECAPLVAKVEKTVKEAKAAGTEKTGGTAERWRTDAVETEEEIAGAPDFYMDEEEREQLMASNYRIVESEEEADAILCSVFQRMECRMSSGDATVDNVAGDYRERVMNL